MDDDPLYRITFPVPFPVWVTSAERYWVIFAKRPRDSVPASDDRQKLPAGYPVVKTSVLGGLHHEYRLVKEAA